MWLFNLQTQQYNLLLEALFGCSLEFEFFGFWQIQQTRRPNVTRVFIKATDNTKTTKPKYENNNILLAVMIQLIIPLNVT